MARFEVHIPAADASGMNVTFRVDADNWMAALKTGLAKLGEEGLAANNVLVDVQDDNSLHVTEAASGRVFRIRELSEQEAARAELKKARVSPPTTAFPQPKEREGSKTLISGPPPGMDTGPGGGAKTIIEPAPAALKGFEPGVVRLEKKAPESTAQTLAPAPAPALPVPAPVSSDAVTPAHGSPPAQPAPWVSKQPWGVAPVPGASAGEPAHREPLPEARSEELRDLRPVAPGVTGLGISSLEYSPSAESVAATLMPNIQPRLPGSRHTPVPQMRGKGAGSISAIVELEKPVEPVKGQIGRSRSSKSAKEQLEDVLSEVFERVNEVHQKKSAEDGLYFLLDLALEKIPAESGTAYYADAGSGDLTFAAVRGPKAKELLAQKPVITAGTGIAGFCSQEGVSVALSDVEKDARFYSAISDKLHYETKSMLCSPVMTHGRTFGALQLMNKKTGSSFSEHELGLLAYIAHQAALFLNLR